MIRKLEQKTTTTDEKSNIPDGKKRRLQDDINSHSIQSRKIPTAAIGHPPSPLPTTDIHTPTSNVFATPRRTNLDHSYMREPSTVSTSSDAVTQTDFFLPPVPLRETGVKRQLNMDIFENSINDETIGLGILDSLSLDSEDDIHKDPTFSPSNIQQKAECSSSSSSSESDSGEEHENLENTYIVYESCLDELHRFRSRCGSPVAERKSFTRGSMLGCRVTCLSGCTYTWRSQSQKRNIPEGNLLISAAIVLTGNTYGRISEFIKPSTFRYSQKVHFQTYRNSMCFL